MLYVFQVDTGTMMMFEMRFAMDTVANLRRAIASKIGTPEEKQVLLISGGESLDNSHKVCSYSSAGTDTSPIFLFAKIYIESSQPPIPNVDYGDDTDMTEMIESCMSMQPSLDTLVARTELAADLNEQAIKQKEICERLVHDQHLQHQGWAAVTANLDDLSRAFKTKTEMLMKAFGEFTKRKPYHKELLNKLGDDIKHLDNIPILPTLTENKQYLGQTYASSSISNQTSAPQATSKNELGQDNSAKTHLSTSLSSGTNTSSSISTSSTSAMTQKKAQQAQTTVDATEQSKPEKKGRKDRGRRQSKQNPEKKASISSVGDVKTSEKGQPGYSASPSQTQNQASDISEETLITLRQWIDDHDSHNSLEKLSELCWRGLERFTDSNAESITQEVQDLLRSVNNVSMKEIKGLEERLYGLEKLMLEARKIVDEQSQLASSFQNNRDRFSKIKDSSVLPDLSASHKQQLQMMLTNHKRMSDLRNRCAKAKQELSLNLHTRLGWIMLVEQKISDLDGKLMIYKENLMRLNRYFEIVDQVHKSPDLYLAATMESLRRRRFSRRYLHWANSIAKISQELYESEMAIRREFDAKLGNHFLSSLFTGLTRSYPPRFATQPPDSFDTKLPRITAADIQFLQSNLSGELAKKLHIPKDMPMPHITNHSIHESVLEEDEDDRHSLNPTPPSSPTPQGL